ncbi:helix-turn-helix domain-containing protein [Streptomyces sp. NPDC047046]|uniref:AraC family transcriptional regulator n=1 Tax=Streptomyces sp. NPDC047046 TaxID=3155378 RepID=UPI0033F5D98C
MTFRERPALRSGGWIWVSTPTGSARAPVLPDGCMDLLWSEEHGLRLAGPDERAQPPGAGPGRWAGYRFAPGTAPALLGVPARALLGLRVPLAEVWPARRVSRLHDALTAALASGTPPGRALETAALPLLTGTPPDPLAPVLLAAARAARPLTETARASGASPRRLHRAALAAFGYGPRTLARVLRLQRTLPLLDAGVPLATTAAEAGYADQPHLTRELRALTGLTPRELRAVRRG